jgi:deoxycytidylate deaminase
MESIFSKISQLVNRDISSKDSSAELKKDTIAEEQNLNEPNQYSKNELEKPEIVIALVAAVGSDLDYFSSLITNELEHYHYKTNLIRISSCLLSEVSPPEQKNTRLEKIDHFMTAGNEYRNLSENNAALAYSAIAEISKKRFEKSGNDEAQPIANQAWIIRSLKNPEEVEALRKTYGDSLFIVGIYSSYDRRKEFLTRKVNTNESEGLVDSLIERDADEGPSNGHGQHTRDTFHLADFFVDADKTKEQNEFDIERIFKLIFANPYITPTFDEYAMYMAFSASTRSADLSRQVGAVLCKDSNILSTGANDVPRANGGLYWPERVKTGQIIDVPNGRDYMRGKDSNKQALSEIITDILSRLKIEDTEAIRDKLKYSKVSDITEYGRVVHAEMEAILSCGRTNNSTVGTALYCTTFPCHNCAKHIIAAGINRVIYVEPYSKSKASDFHNDSLSFGGINHFEGELVSFEPFVGVGPRSFLHLFSMKLGSGTELKRKNKHGITLDWQKESAMLRMQSDPIQYIKQETLACSIAEKDLNKFMINKEKLESGS